MRPPSGSCVTRRMPSCPMHWRPPSWSAFRGRNKRMPSTFQLLFDGTAADAELYTALSTVEVEENVDLPGAIQLHLPVSRSAEGDRTYVSDGRFKPFASLALVAQVEDGPAQCLFDGYALSHKLHLQTGTTASTLKVWGQDAEWTM